MKTSNSTRHSSEAGIAFGTMKRMNTAPPKAFSAGFLTVALVALGLGAPGPARAETYYWNWVSSGTYAWNDSFNWASTFEGFPNAFDDIAIIDWADINGSQTISLNQAITVGTLQLGDTDGDYTYTIAAGTGGPLAFASSDPAGALLRVSNPSASSGDTISAPILMNGTLRVAVLNPGNRLTLSGPISGSGPFRMTSPGTVRFDAGPVNGYSGATQVWSGTLELDNDGFNVAIPGALEIGDAIGGANSAVVRLMQSIEINDAAPVTVNADGLFDINSKSEAIGVLTINLGNVALSGGDLAVSRVEMTGGTMSGSASSSLRLGGGLYATPGIGADSGTISARIDLNGATREFGITDGEMLISGAIVGSGGVYKSSIGRLRLGGSAANTYTGTTTVELGELDLDNDGINLAIPGPLIVGLGFESPWFSPVVRLFQSAEINDIVPVTVNSDGIFDINGYGDVIGALTVNRGKVTLGDGYLQPSSVAMTGGEISSTALGDLRLGGSVTATSDRNANAARIGARVNLNGATRTFAADDGPGAVDLVISNSIFGSGGVTKSGAGTLRIGGASPNTYSGPTYVQDGVLELAGGAFDEPIPGVLIIGDGFGLIGGAVVRRVDGAGLKPSSAVTVNFDGLLDLNGYGEDIGVLTVNSGSVTIGANWLYSPSVTMTGGTISGTGAGYLELGGNLAATSNGAGNAATISALVDLNGGTRTFTVADGPGAFDMLITGAIYDSQSAGGVTKSGAGTLRIGGASPNTYRGPTYVQDGVLELAGGDFVEPIPGTLIIGDGTGVANSAVVRRFDGAAINPSSAVTVNFDGLLDLNGYGQRLGALTVNGGRVALDFALLQPSSVTMTGGSIGSAGGGELRLTSTVTATSNSAGNAATISAPINLDFANRTFAVDDGPGVVDLLITGATYDWQLLGGVTKSGTGTLRFSGPAANTYPGLTYVQDGVLELEKTPGAVAISGNLTIGDGVGAPASAVVRLLQSIQIAATSAVLVAPDGRLDANGLGSGVGSLTIDRGSVTLGSGQLLTPSLTMVAGSISGSGTLSLHGDATATSSAAGPATVSARVDLSGVTRTFNVNDGPGAVDLDLSGAIVNIGGGASVGVTKAGAGTLRFSGSATNFYLGVTSVDDGVLELNNDLFDVAVPGLLFIGDGVGAANSAVVRLLQHAEINNAAPVTVNFDGLFDLNSYADVIGALSINRGSVALGTGNVRPTSVTMTGGTISGAGGAGLWLSSDVMAVSDGAGNAAVISSPVFLNDATRTFAVSDGPGALDLLASGVIFGTGGVTKSGAGTLRLGGSSVNTFIGLTYVQDGVLELEKTPGAVAISGNLTIGDGVGAPASAVVRLLQSIQIAATSAVLVAPDGRLDANGLGSGVGSLTIDRGSVTLGSGQLLTPSLTMVAGSISGTGTFSLQGNLTATSTAAGPATVSAQVDLNGATRVFTVNDGPGAIDLDLAGAIVNIGGGAAIMRKTGGGILELSSNQVSVPIQIAEGSVLFRTVNSQPMFLDGGTLIGNGTASGGLTSMPGGGIVAPLGNPGATAILVTGPLNLNAATTLQMEVLGAAAGSGFDQLSATGSVGLGGATLSLHYLAGFNVALGQSIVLLANDGSDPIIGEFDGLPPDTFIPVPAVNGGGGWIITYTGGTGNDVVLTRATTPPSNAPPAITNFTIGAPDAQGNSPVSVTGTGAPGVSYRLERSTDLVVWIPEGAAQNAAAGTGALNFIVTVPAVRRREFYRILRL